MEIYMDEYKNLLLCVKEMRGLTLLLKLLDTVAVILTVCAFTGVLITTAISDMLSAIRLAGICAIPFAIVSLIRRLLNAPRPYELYPDIYDRPPKKRKGHSFPSRHVFSAFSIGTVLCFLYPVIGVSVLASGLTMSVSRVLLGKHFPRDVIAGALIGTVTSIIGMIIMI